MNFGTIVPGPDDAAPEPNRSLDKQRFIEPQNIRITEPADKGALFRSPKNRRLAERDAEKKTKNAVTN
jgi:hypothetical protein